MQSVAHIQGVTVVRGTHTLLDDVSLAVHEGQRWVILGPNGAGKSTLIRVLAARLHPSKGSVQILDETVGRVDVFELRPLIGLASQDLTDSIPHAEKVLDVVMSASYSVVGRWRERYEQQDIDRARSLLATFAVGHLHERAFATLSTGEKKRVASARALMTDPQLLLLDEPASGLDMGGREELVHSLSILAHDPATPVTVMVTHHVEEIPEGFTHAALMREGRIVAAGPIDETLTSPLLTRTFGLPLVVSKHEGRWSARALNPRIPS